MLERMGSCNMRQYAAHNEETHQCAGEVFGVDGVLEMAQPISVTAGNAIDTLLDFDNTRIWACGSESMLFRAQMVWKDDDVVSGHVSHQNQLHIVFVDLCLFWNLRYFDRKRLAFFSHIERLHAHVHCKLSVLSSNIRRTILRIFSLYHPAATFL